MAHILVIDDEPEIVQVVREVLEQAGHEVLNAPDGKVGMKIFGAHPVDLIITDIIMPGQEGLETIRELRARTQIVSGNTKILAMSGGGRLMLMDVLKIAKLFGADDTIEKPFTKKEFMDKVNRLLES